MLPMFPRGPHPVPSAFGALWSKCLYALGGSVSKDVHAWHLNPVLSLFCHPLIAHWTLLEDSLMLFVHLCTLWGQWPYSTHLKPERVTVTAKVSTAYREQRADLDHRVWSLASCVLC